MVRIKINNRGISSKETILKNIRNIEYENEYKLKIKITCDDPHYLKNNDTIILENKDGDQRYYRETYTITYVDDYSFLIDAPSDYSINISYVETGDTIYYISEDDTYKKAKCLNFYLDTHHDFLTYRNGVNVKEEIDKLYYYTANDFYNKKCVGDYIICNGFLYQTDGIIEKDISGYDGLVYSGATKYTFKDDDYLNISDKYIYFYMPTEEDGEYINKKIILGGGKISDTEDSMFEGFYKVETGKTISKDDCNGMLLVPIIDTGYENSYHLQWYYTPSSINDNKIVRYILNNLSNITFYCKDERFFTENYTWSAYTGSKKLKLVTQNLPDSNWNFEDDVILISSSSTRYICLQDLTLNKRSETSLYKYDGNYTIKIPLVSDFMTDAPKNDQRVISDFIERKKEESINKIIDYEKVQFSPVFLNSKFFDVVSASSLSIDEFIVSSGFTEDYIKEADSLTFNLHLRDRKNSDGTIDDEFQTSIDKYWNNYQSVKKDTIYSTKGEEWESDSNADLLGDVGFTNEDIYYQKKKLKKTFIRISCYDSNNTGSQNMQAYNTMFLDATSLYQKYIKILSSEELSATTKENAVNEYIKNENDENLSLTLSFKCKNKYNSDMSSEGFYFYLFPTLVNGSIPTPLYLKIDLNHAKYGVTVPLSYPVDGFGKIDLKNFPVSYNDSDNGTDIERLWGDIYLKIYIMYSPKLNKYIWFFPYQMNANSDLEINLWEPRISDYN